MPTITERTDSTGNKSFVARVRVKGYPTQTQTFKRKTDAREWANKIESDIKSGLTFPHRASQKRTVRELIERYSKQLTESSWSTKKKQQLIWWVDNLGHALLAHVTPAILNEALDKLVSSPTNGSGRSTPFFRSSATANRYLASLSACFTKGVEWGWLNSNPCEGVKRLKESRGRVRYLADDEQERLLRAAQESANPHLYLWIVMSLATGGRTSEILGLEWRDIDLKRQEITFRETKNGEDRTVPLIGEALELLLSRSKVRDIRTPLVFPSPTNPTRRIDVRSAWDTAIKRAGLTDFRPHDLRHSAASFLAMAGASPLEIGSILGHKTLAMVRRYSHLSTGHLRGVMERAAKTKLGGE